MFKTNTQETVLLAEIKSDLKDVYFREGSRKGTLSKFRITDSEASFLHRKLNNELTNMLVGITFCTAFRFGMSLQSFATFNNLKCNYHHCEVIVFIRGSRPCRKLRVTDILLEVPDKWAPFCCAVPAGVAAYCSSQT